MFSAVANDVLLDDGPIADGQMMSRAELEAAGFVIGFGSDLSEADYRGDPCKHASLNQSLAKELVQECPEDAWRQHPKGGAVKKDATDAMEESSIFDQLLTADVDHSAPALTEVWKRPVGKPKKGGVQEFDEVGYVDWQGFRIIEADGFTKHVARECRDNARAVGLVPVLQSKLEKAANEALEMRTRLELAGIDLRAGKRQVVVYWVEFADDGTPIQCRGKLDQLDGLLIRDLKAVASLNRRFFARQAYDNGLHIQAAAYTSAVEKVTGQYGRVKYEWAIVRKGQLPAAARRKPSGQLKRLGEIEWRYAINMWAKCLRTGLWPNYELAGLEQVEAEPWMAARTGELTGEVLDV